MTGKKGQIPHNLGEKHAAKLRGDKHYFTGIPCKRGHIALRFTKCGSCMECKVEANAKKSKNLTEEQIKKRNEYQRLYASKWLSEHPEAYISRQIYKKTWVKNNPEKVLANKAKRRSSEIKRTPSWLNAGHWFEIESIYAYCASLRYIGLDYHVDHIVPLQGKNVSGLHMPWNLQIIHATENFQKGNRHVQ
jgi:hypothetical protein